MWSLEKLADYLLKKKIVTDPNWLDNYLRKTFYKAYAHIGKMA